MDVLLLVFNVLCENRGKFLLENSYWNCLTGIAYQLQ